MAEPGCTAASSSSRVKSVRLQGADRDCQPTPAATWIVVRRPPRRGPETRPASRYGTTVAPGLPSLPGSAAMATIASQGSSMRPGAVRIATGRGTPPVRPARSRTDAPTWWGTADAAVRYVSPSGPSGPSANGATSLYGTMLPVASRSGRSVLATTPNSVGSVRVPP